MGQDSTPSSLCPYLEIYKLIHKVSALTFSHSVVLASNPTSPNSGKCVNELDSHVKTHDLTLAVISGDKSTSVTFLKASLFGNFFGVQA
jgi:hypothetical protein